MNRAVLVCLVALLPGVGCRLVKRTAAVPQQIFFPGGKSHQPDPGELQEILMRYADGYTAQTTKSVDELIDVAGSPFGQREALNFKITSASGGISIATGQNPYANLIDMVSLVSLSRMVLEDYSSSVTNGELYEPWLRRSKRLETNVWKIADQVLQEEQQADLREALETVYDSLPDLHKTFFVRPQELGAALPRTLSTDDDEGGLFNLSGLDIFSGLDPAVREITETRMFAERAMYMLQRMPWLLRWQSELLLLEATTQPQMAQALEDVTQISQSIDRASKAAETISETAAELPDRISAEREALVNALEDQEGQLTTLMVAGTELSESLSVTITNTDALMKRFGVGEPKPPGAQVKPGTNSKPFDILEYAQVAEQATLLARELDSVVSNLHATLESPALEKLSDQATADVRGILNHAFLLAGGLVVLMLVCGLVYRAVAGRKRSSKNGM